MAWLIIGSGVQEPLTVVLLEASPANPVIINGMCLIPPKQPTDKHISTAPVVASGHQCWESESAPAVSSTNTQRDIDSCAESGSGKPPTCQSELTSKSFTPSSIRQLNSVGQHLAFFKSTHSKARCNRRIPFGLGSTSKVPCRSSATRPPCSALPRGTPSPKLRVPSSESNGAHSHRPALYVPHGHLEACSI